MAQCEPRVLISEQDIQARVRALAERISADYADRQPVVLIGVLKGSYMFLADLSRRLDVDRSIEFIAVSSYGEAGAVSGAVRLVMDVRESIEDKHVLIVEDIVDTGQTLNYLIEMLGSRHPASISTCVLVRKQLAGGAHIEVDYLGFEIGDEWVVGYGLDYAEQNRALPYIGAIDPDGL